MISSEAIIWWYLVWLFHRKLMTSQQHRLNDLTWMQSAVYKQFPWSHAGVNNVNVNQKPFCAPDASFYILQLCVFWNAKSCRSKSAQYYICSATPAIYTVDYHEKHGQLWFAGHAIPFATEISWTISDKNSSFLMQCFWMTVINSDQCNSAL